jgi:sulfur-carrier protein
MIVVKYFGAIAEKTKTKEEILPLKEYSLKQLVNELEQKYQLNEIRFCVAINQKIVQDIEKHELKDHDIIALLPPFAGG